MYQCFDFAVICAPETWNNRWTELLNLFDYIQASIYETSRCNTHKTKTFEEFIRRLERDVRGRSDVEKVHKHVYFMRVWKVVTIKPANIWILMHVWKMVLKKIPTPGA